MASQQRFQVNRPSVIHEILDDELVIVNLRSGSYYSLDPVGAAVWREVDDGSTEDEIASALQARFDGETAVIASAVAALLDELQSESLIVPAAPAATRREGAAPAGTNGRMPFAAPLLHKYTDMQDLLLLDPIHEVDEAGWPTRKA